MQRIMLDLETMGQVPGCAFVSAGACKFQNSQIVDTFYRRIDLQSCLDLGLEVDASTILWWMGNSDEARKEIMQPGVHIAEFLQQFDQWSSGGQREEFELWGNGADFDNALLATAYHYNSLPPPWKYFNNRCYRTVKNLYPHIPMPKFEGTKHNALIDACNQAKHLMLMRPEL